MARQKPTRADVRAADDWWGTLTDEKRVSTHRWLAGLGKMPAPSQPETLFDEEGRLTVGDDAEPPAVGDRGR